MAIIVDRLNTAILSALGGPVVIFRGTLGNGGGGGVTDHGALTGLTDDDHPQYALADGSRGAFATAAQGALADSAVQPSDGLSGDLSGTYASPVVSVARGLRETGGPTSMEMAVVADGAFLYRKGSEVAGAGFGSSAGTICEGNDSRLSDARTPTSHASSHQSGGGDAIKLDDLAAPDDNTDLDATTSAHGLLPKLSGVSTEFLNGNGAFATPAGGGSSNTRWIGAGELIPRVTNGAGIDGEELATNDINLDYLAFDTGTSEGAQASFAWPSGFTTFTATFHWTAASGSGGVRWQCSARCYADDDALDQTQGTSQAVSDTFLAANDAHKSAVTSAITPAGTASAGNLCVIEVERDPSHADDTLAVDARLIGVLLEFAA